MKIKKSQLKQIIKEEIEEAKGIPGPEYHDTATRIGRGRFYSDEAEETQGPARPGEMQIVADYVNKKIPAWLNHVEEMKEKIENPAPGTWHADLVKVSPGIKQLIGPMDQFLFHVRNLQKNLEQDKPIRRHAMGQPFSHDYVEVPSEIEERVYFYTHQELHETFAAAAGYANTVLYPKSTEKQKRMNPQPNYAKIAKSLLGVLRSLVGGRDMTTWRGSHRETNPETGITGGPISYSSEKDIYPMRYPRYIGENLKKITKSQLKQIIKEELEGILADAVVYGGQGPPAAHISMPGEFLYKGKATGGMVPGLLSAIPKSEWDNPQVVAALEKYMDLQRVTRAGGKRRQEAEATLKDLKGQFPAAATAFDDIIFAADQIELKRTGASWIDPSSRHYRWEKTT